MVCAIVLLTSVNCEVSERVKRGNEKLLQAILEATSGSGYDHHHHEEDVHQHNDYSEHIAAEVNSQLTALLQLKTSQANSIQNDDYGASSGWNGNQWNNNNQWNNAADVETAKEVSMQ